MAERYSGTAESGVKVKIKQKRIVQTWICPIDTISGGGILTHTQVETSPELLARAA